jgi:hypothetical protein
VVNVRFGNYMLIIQQRRTFASFNEIVEKLSNNLNKKEFWNKKIDEN